MNYAKNNASGTIYQSLSAEAHQPKADNTLRDLHSSSDHTEAKFNITSIDVKFKSIVNCLFIGKFRR